MKKLPAVFSGLFLIAACTRTYPVAVITPAAIEGVMRGEVTGSREGGGSFSVTDGRLTCAGTFAGIMAETITIPVLCNDGRKGLVTATRTGVGGYGRFTLTDGTTGDFIYGDAAKSL